MAALAATIWMMFYLGLDWWQGKPDGWLWSSVTAPPVLWLACFVFRAQARLSLTSLPYGRFEVTLRHVQNYPFTIAGVVRFAPPLSANDRLWDWRVHLALDVITGSDDNERLASGQALLQFDDDGRRGRFEMRIKLRDQLPTRRVKLQVRIEPEGRKLYGMPICFFEPLRFGVDS